MNSFPVTSETDAARSECTVMGEAEHRDEAESEGWEEKGNQDRFA